MVVKNYPRDILEAPEGDFLDAIFSQEPKNLHPVI
jgi:hypothetical protein